MKTNELSGVVLDLAVAKCEGVPLIAGCLFTKDPKDGTHYSPSTNWAQGGPIIEREKISLIWMQFSDEQYWLASIDVGTLEAPKECEARGDAPLIAAMRCYVLSKLGDEVQIPEGIQ